MPESEGKLGERRGILLAKNCGNPATWTVFQLSNELIRRCCKEINLDRIFDGYVQSSMKTLNECIECCEQWKEHYDKVMKNVMAPDLILFYIY